MDFIEYLFLQKILYKKKESIYVSKQCFLGKRRNPIGNKTKASEISSSSESSIWNEYKQFDVNGNGSLTDDIDLLSNDSLTSLGQKLGIISDGTIGATKQSEQTGDCYLLSSLNALSETSWGKEAIDNAIKSDGQGGYNVTFYNADGELEQITVSSDELSANPEKYSSCDVDIKIIEVAAEKFYAAHADEEAYSFKNADNPLTEGLMEGKTSLAYMLTGSEGHVLQLKSVKIDKRIPKSALASDRDKLTNDSLTEALLNIASSSDQYASMCSFKKPGLFDQIFGNPNIVADHGYSISSVLQNSSGGIEAVVLKNPWDSSKEIIMPFNDFKSRIMYFVSHNKNDIF